MNPRNDGSAPGLSGCPDPISRPGPATSISRNVPTVDRLFPALIVPRIGRTFPESRPMRKKPRFVVSRKSFVRGSMSSALTYGGFFAKSTSRSERGVSASPGASEPHPAAASATTASAAAASRDERALMRFPPGRAATAPAS